MTDAAAQVLSFLRPRFRVEGSLERPDRDGADVHRHLIQQRGVAQHRGIAGVQLRLQLDARWQRGCKHRDDLFNQRLHMHMHMHRRAVGHAAATKVRDAPHKQPRPRPFYLDQFVAAGIERMA